MHCVAALHSPLAPQVQLTALDARATDGTRWSGAADGGITCWKQQQHAGSDVMQPMVVLQGHAHPVVALLSGLTVQGCSYLLSLDAEGWVGLWDCSSWVCLDMSRAAPLPPGCRPSLLLMPDGEHVCIIIPATPSLQQEQQQTLWQHQRQQQQQQQQQAAHTSPLSSPQQQQQHSATAAQLSPMMLVLRWRSLALVCAPLVSNLGLAALTSSSISLDQPDAVVAAAVLDTAPALAPTAADSVVLAVMRSGWVWAGSLAGSSLAQAWERPLATGGSSAPLTHSCLRVCSSSSAAGANSNSSAGGSSSASPDRGSQQPGVLQLLLVQPDGWRLFVCSSFSSTDGMPQQWVQVAAQQQPQVPRRLHSCSQHPSKAAGAASGSCAAAADSATSTRVRFSLGPSNTSSGSSGSSGSESESASGSESEQEAESQAYPGSRLQQASARDGTQHRQKRQQHEAAALLGGTLLQPPSVSGSSRLQEPWQSAAAAAGAGGGVPIAVVVWSDNGQQQLWCVQLQSSADAMQQQQQQTQLVQQSQLQPWPAGTAAKLFAAVNQLHSSVSLLVQHSHHTHHHHHHHHHHHEQQSSSSTSWLLPDVSHRWRGDWHMHCSVLTAGQSQAQQQQQPASSSCVPWRLQHCQGAWGASWSRHGLLPSANDSQHGLPGSSSISHLWESPSNSAEQQQQQHSQGATSSSGEATGTDAMQVDSSAGVNSSRKRPAVGEPAAAESLGGQDGPGVKPGPAPGRAKQPRVQPDEGRGDASPQAAAEQLAAALLDGQQQQVTHMLLLGSDAPGMYQLAVALASGTLLFYDLATYCVPGAAWHPDCCVVGAGHTGQISTTLEVTFKCPPQHLLGCAGAADGSTAWHSAHGALARPVSWNFSSSNRAEHSGQPSMDEASGSGDGAGRGRAQQQQRYESVECPAAAQGWATRPAQGGVVPLLLTGGRDGSVRAWDLRLQHLGQTWMAVHPHTAPVEAVVLPPVSSRLPWSTCVLSCCTAGRVALTCLAAGATTRTFDGWQLGPPAQLAWSTGRGLLAAGGWDAAGVWQVAVWDTYSGHLDRQLQGAAAHMLMATLAQELTSSMRHLSRAQAQPHAAAAPAAAGAAGQQQAGPQSGSGYGQAYHSSSTTSGSGSKRASFDVPVPSSPASDAGKAAGGGSSSGSSADVGGFNPRLQLVSHTGVIRPVPYGRRDALMLDIDVQQLVAQLEAYSKQQRRENSSSRQRAQQQHAGLAHRSSMDVDGSTAGSSARASRASSLDLMGLVQEAETLPASLAASTRTSPQQAAPHAPQASTPAGQPHATGLQASPAGMSRQGSLAASAADGPGPHGGPATHAEGQRGPGTLQQAVVHGRTVLAPAIAGAVQGLCLLHKWGLEPKLDQQLVLLLEQLQGWPGSAARAGLFTQHSSSSQPMSPTTPTAPQSPQAASATECAADDGSQCAGIDDDGAGVEVQLLAQVQLLLAGPAPGSPVLQALAPCLSQEVLLSPGCHAAAVAMPALHNCAGLSHSQHSPQHTPQQGQRVGNLSQQLAAGPEPPVLDKQPSGSSSSAGAAVGVSRRQAAISSTNLLLLTCCPTLLSSRLLTLVGLSKWLMASIPSHTSVNTCSGLVTLYALHSTELLTQAAAAAAATPTATLAATAVVTSPRASTPAALRGSPAQPQLSQQRQDHDAPVLPDLVLIASTSLACPGLLAEAAQLLLAALLHPAPPGTFLPPTLAQAAGWAGRGSPQLMPQQQQGVLDQVFTSPGAAAAASCWPSAVLQLAVLQAQNQQQQGPSEAVPLSAVNPPGNASALSLQQLPMWMPQLVLAAAAAVAHPTRMPPELLAAVAAGLLDVLLGAAPAHSSCVAASWLCQVLRGGHWALWRPYLGKPGHLVHRLCHLIDRLQANSTDSRTAASHLVTQSLSASPGLQHPANMHGSTSTAAAASSSSSSSSDFTLLPQQPYAVADPLASAGSGIARGLSSNSSSAAGPGPGLGGGWQRQHVEGGLFLSAALLGPSTARQGSWPLGGALSRSASPAAGAAAAAAAGGGGSGNLLELSPGSCRVGGGSGAGLVSHSGSGPLGFAGAAAPQHAHRTPSGLTYSYTGGHGPTGGSAAAAKPGSSGSGSGGAGYGQGQASLGTISEQQQQQLLMGVSSVRVSRSVLVVWLRAALDVVAALTHVDPGAVLMELSHKLAAPTAESAGTSLTLLMAALSRLLKRPSERPALLPHLGFITALAVQALDPGRPLLRHTLLQPVMGVIRDLASHFPQVDCHSSSLQVAVGSTRALAGPYSGEAGEPGAAVGSCVQAPTVAVFDMNGGTKKKVLLLPVLLDDGPDHHHHQQQQQQQGGSCPGSQGLHSAPAGPVGPGAVSAHGHVGPFGSNASLYSTNSSASNAQEAAAGGAAQRQGVPLPVPRVSGALPGLWSAAEGVPGAAGAAGRVSSGGGGVLGGSSSSLSSSTAYDTPTDSRSGSYGRLGELQRSALTSNTMTRAEAAMLEGWFGGSTGSSGDGGPAAQATLHAATPGSGGDGGTGPPAAAGGGWGGVSSRPKPAASMQCGVIYADAASAGSAVLCASEVSGGVAAVAFSPGGDAVAAFVLGCHCLVVWRLGASWTQKLAHLGSSRPMSQLPHAYIRLPAAALLVNAVFKDGAAGQQQQQRNHHRHHHHHQQHSASEDGEGGVGGEVLRWQLRWQTGSHIDLLYQGCLCGSVEVQV